MATEMSPVCSEMRDPKRMRVNRSRPRMSVPNQCRALGGFKPSTAFISSGSHGVSRGAATAAAISPARMMPPSSALFDRRNRRNASPHGERGAARPRAWALVEADARIEVGIRKVHDQIDDGVDQRDEQHGTLDNRKVLVRDRVHQ